MRFFFCAFYILATSISSNKSALESELAIEFAIQVSMGFVSIIPFNVWWNAACLVASLD